VWIQSYNIGAREYRAIKTLTNIPYGPRLNGPLVLVRQYQYPYNCSTLLGNEGYYHPSGRIEKNSYPAIERNRGLKNFFPGMDYIKKGGLFRVGENSYRSR